MELPLCLLALCMLLRSTNVSYQNVLSFRAVFPTCRSASSAREFSSDDNTSTPDRRMDEANDADTPRFGRASPPLDGEDEDAGPSGPLLSRERGVVSPSPPPPSPPS